jgi:6-pyruvoyltetrahydropterin/6-carboxytetrahydropterin synthase
VFELSQSFIFEGAHTLTRTVPIEEFEASRRIHGHTYTAEVTVRGTKGASGMVEVPRRGKVGPWVMDLYELRKAIERVRAQLDHHFLDEVPGLGPATLENLCEFIARGIELPVHAVTVSRATGDKCRLTLPAAPAVVAMSAA